MHDYSHSVVPQDVGKEISALNLVVSTGNDDLRGGSHAGDNCDVSVELASGTIALLNVNGGHNWTNWTDHTVPIPLPAGGLKGGDVKGLKLHTGFGGGIGGDNWNVNRIQLQATLASISSESLGWFPWFLVHNEVKMEPGAVVTALWRSNNTHLDLFATGNDGAVWSTSWEAAHGWFPWFLVHNEVKMQPGATVTALWRSNHTHLDLFATGNDGAVWSASWEASHGWNPWSLVHNEVKMQPGAAVTAAWRSNETHLDLFVTGNDGAVWSTSWEAPRGWNPWFLVHNEVRMQPGATVAAVWRSNETHLDLFATGNNGAVWSTSWEAARGWNPWFLVHNEVKMQRGATVTALWRSNETHLDLFATGNDGAVWSTSWEGNSGM